eukprot:TRINITY_DN30159_c1_g3_i4.p1 TRINITY_DN30159_c1_g3~~TRINITY_DN30159_c1_g3_i4.p1  ORF type:complete len:502 (+),score=67.03 TRINITY_DN30159_c1_g3_i4:138-1643(+)
MLVHVLPFAALCYNAAEAVRVGDVDKAELEGPVHRAHSRKTAHSSATDGLFEDKGDLEAASAVESKDEQELIPSWLWGSSEPEDEDEEEVEMYDAQICAAEGELCTCYGLMTWTNVTGDPSETIKTPGPKEEEEDISMQEYHQQQLQLQQQQQQQQGEEDDKEYSALMQEEEESLAEGKPTPTIAQENPEFLNIRGESTCSPTDKRWERPPSYNQGEFYCYCLPNAAVRKKDMLMSQKSQAKRVKELKRRGIEKGLAVNGGVPTNCIPNNPAFSNGIPSCTCDVGYEGLKRLHGLPDVPHAIKELTVDKLTWSFPDKAYDGRCSVKCLKSCAWDVRMDDNNYDYLLFEGGGVRGAAYGGVIRALEELGILQRATGFAGASAGSVTAAALAAGFNATEFLSAVPDDWNILAKKQPDDDDNWMKPGDLFGGVKSCSKHFFRDDGGIRVFNSLTLGLSTTKGCFTYGLSPSPPSVLLTFAPCWSPVLCPLFLACEFRPIVRVCN